MDRLLVTPRTVARQAPLSMGFPRQENGSGLPFPALGDLPDSGIEPISPMFPALAAGFFITEPSGKPSLQRLCVHTHTPPAALGSPHFKGNVYTHTHRHTHTPSLQSLCVHTHTHTHTHTLALTSKAMCTHTHTHTPASGRACWIWPAGGARVSIMCVKFSHVSHVQDQAFDLPDD